MLPTRTSDWMAACIIFCYPLYSKRMCPTVIVVWALACGLNTNGETRVSSMLYELFHALLQRCHYPCLCRLDSWLTQSLWSKGKALTPSRPQWDGCSAHGWGLAEVDATENSCDATLVVGRTYLLSPPHNLGNSGACNGDKRHWVENTDQASSLTALLRWNAGLQRRVTPTTATIDRATIPGIYIRCLI